MRLRRLYLSRYGHFEGQESNFGEKKAFVMFLSFTGQTRLGDRPRFWLGLTCSTAFLKERALLVPVRAQGPSCGCRERG